MQDWRILGHGISLVFLLFGFLARTKEFNQGRSPPQIRPSRFRAKNNPLLSTIAPKPRYIRLSALPRKLTGQQ